MGVRGGLAGALSALALVGCAGAIEPADDALLRETFRQVRDGRTQEVEQSLDPSLRTQATRTALGQLRTMIQAAGSPCERSMIRVTTNRSVGAGGSARQLTAQHQYVCPNHILIVEAALRQESGGPTLIQHFVITPVAADAVVASADFDLQGKSPRHYAFLTAAVASPLLMLIALLGVIFTKGFKRKWLWGIISLAGIAKFSMIWSTGQIVSSVLSVNLIGFGIARDASPLSPWIVSFTPPIGAIIALSLLWPRWAGLSEQEQP